MLRSAFCRLNKRDNTSTNDIGECKYDPEVISLLMVLKKLLSLRKKLQIILCIYLKLIKIIIKQFV